MLIHTVEEKDTRRKLVAAVAEQNNTRNLEGQGPRERERESERARERERERFFWFLENLYSRKFEPQ